MRVLGLACVAIGVAACGGGGDGGGGGTPPPPQVASVVITAPTSAQTTIAPCGTVNFTAQARDAQGGAISGAAITWNPTGTALNLSSNTGASTTGTGVAVGSSTVTASSGSATSTGVNVTVAGGNPGSNADVTASATANTFSPSCVVITAGGTVDWTFGALTHNVQFQGTKPTGGDIDNSTNTTVTRTFPNAGSYPYQCTLHAGMNGRVVVVQ